MDSTPAVKFAKGSDTDLDLLAIPFTSPLPGGRDFDGEYFSPRTDLCLSWFPAERPLLYEHGLDDALKAEVIGRVDSATLRTDDEGHWVRAQLNRAHGYYRKIKRLIEADALGGSSGSVPHLVRVAKSGEILRWPWVEQSLTPTPANPHARVSASAVEKHYKSLGLDFDLPDALKALGEGALSAGGALVAPQYGAKATWTAAEINDLPDSSFAYIESGGTKDADGKTTPRSLRHFPYKGADGKPDAAHVRNALARIPQSSLPQSAKDAALRTVQAAAKELGIGEAAKALAIKQGHPEGSYEDLIADLNALVNPSSPFAPASYARIVATFPDACIVCRYGGDDGEEAYYRVAYTIGPDQEPVLGDATRVEMAYQPVAAPGGGDGGAAKRLRDATARLKAALALADRRLGGLATKDARVLSGTNYGDVKEIHARAAAVLGRHDAAMARRS